MRDFILFKRKTLLLGLIFAFIFFYCSQALASPLGVRLGLQGANLHVEWDQVPETVDGGPFLTWGIFIFSERYGNIFVCGFTITFVNCPFGRETTSLDIDLIQRFPGGLPQIIPVSASITAFYGPYPGASWITQYIGGAGGTVTFPPLLEKVSGDTPIQEGPINSTLPLPMVVKTTDASGNPASGGQINWTITGPPGAIGMSVSPQTGTQVAVRLGNKSGDYTVTATCPNCTSGSPQTFTARAIGCGGLTLDLFPNEVWPTLSTGSHDNTAAVIPQITNPAPPSGCVVDFDVDPVHPNAIPMGFIQRIRQERLHPHALSLKVL